MSKLRRPGQVSQPTLLPLVALIDATECLRVMAHPVRLRIVDILMQGEFQVHQIARFCELPPHQVSEHLRLLHGRKLLASERRGRSVFYRVDSPQLPALLKCLRRTCARKT